MKVVPADSIAAVWLHNDVRDVPAYLE